MPRQNRVTPFSTLIAVASRGTLMGNRGCLHGPTGVMRREYQGKRWIICLLDFKDRHRSVMSPGQYTELFFLDEATAFAAGHRPCAECQRERFELFREIWIRAGLPSGGIQRPPATAIDRVLHDERLQDGQKRTYLAGVDSLPDGAFVTDEREAEAYLVLRKGLFLWGPSGYASTSLPELAQPVRVLTPRPLVAVLAAGYPVMIHPSAFEARARCA